MTRHRCATGVMGCANMNAALGPAALFLLRLGGSALASRVGGGGIPRRPVPPPAPVRSGSRRTMSQPRHRTSLGVTGCRKETRKIAIMAQACREMSGKNVEIGRVDLRSGEGR